MKLSEKTFSRALQSLTETLAQHVEASCKTFDTHPDAVKHRIRLVQKSFAFFRKTYFPQYYTTYRDVKKQPLSWEHTETSDDSTNTLKRTPSPSVSCHDHTTIPFNPSSLHTTDPYLTKKTHPYHRDDAVLHRWLDKKLPTVMDASKGQWVAIAAPRGEAKSTLISLFFVLWAIITKRKRYILLIADTFEQSIALIDAIKHELLSNHRLGYDFPDATGEGTTWNVHTLITRSCIKVQALGAGTRMRGLRYGPHRPDLVILDDLENDEHVRKPEQRDKLHAWLQKTVLNLGAADNSMDIIYIGTILHYDSVLARTIHKPLWQTKIFRAIIQWPDRMDLWDQWEHILLEQGKQHAQHFWETQQQAMLQGSNVSWPAIRPLYQLMLRRAENHAAFDSEYQNDPLCGEDAPFTHCIHYWTTASKEWIHFGVCDPSLGKHGAGRDPSALLIGGFCPKTMTLHVLEALIRKRHPDRIIEDIISLHQQYTPVLWGVEAVQFQEFFAHVLVQRAETKGIALPVKPLINNTDKLLRIESLQPHMAQQHILVHHSQQTLIHQLRHFPKADHDDGPDALEMLWRIARSYASIKDMIIVHSDEPTHLDTHASWR